MPIICCIHIVQQMMVHLHAHKKGILLINIRAASSHESPLQHHLYDIGCKERTAKSLLDEQALSPHRVLHAMVIFYNLLMISAMKRPHVKIIIPYMEYLHNYRMWDINFGLSLNYIGPLEDHSRKNDRQVA